MFEQCICYDVCNLMTMVIISCIWRYFSIWIILELFIQVKVMNLVLFIKVYVKNYY